jgi:hypothetical protein
MKHAGNTANDLSKLHDFRTVAHKMPPYFWLPTVQYPCPEKQSSVRTELIIFVEYFGRVGQGEKKKALEIPRFVFYNEKKGVRRELFEADHLFPVGSVALRELGGLCHERWIRKICQHLQASGCR